MSSPGPVGPSRDDTETMTDPRHRVCPVCATAFVPVGRQRYDTNACRQVAHRRRHADPVEPADVPPARARRDQTVYACIDCDVRYLAQQWCYDCARPCRRLGPGGECGCGELLTVDELLGGAPMA
jgi:hypothetical protein